MRLDTLHLMNRINDNLGDDILIITVIMETSVRGRLLGTVGVGVSYGLLYLLVAMHVRTSLTDPGWRGEESN